MRERLFYGYSGQLFRGEISKRAAARSQNNPFDGFPLPGLQTLKDRAMLAIDRQNLRAGASGQFHYQRSGHDQGFFIGQSHSFSGLHRCPGALQSSGPNNRCNHACRSPVPLPLEQAIPAPTSNSVSVGSVDQS